MSNSKHPKYSNPDTEPVEAGSDTYGVHVITHAGDEVTTPAIVYDDNTRAVLGALELIIEQNEKMLFILESIAE